MSIRYLAESGTFTLHTDACAYQMKVDAHGVLLHTYFGAEAGDADASAPICYMDRGFSGNPSDLARERAYSLDSLPQEYPAEGTGDYRVTALAVRFASGASGCDLRYVSHRIGKGKYALRGQPALFDGEGDAQTLEITLKDRFSELYVHLLYGVFPHAGVITRAARIENRGSAPVTLRRAASMALDADGCEHDLIHFYGRHAMERMTERTALPHGILQLRSTRGTSSHQHNPFVVLADRAATEDFGACCGIALLYSGGFDLQAEVDQLNQTRLVFGIDDEDFGWVLAPGESFETPEACLAYSGEGFTALSQRLHAAYNACLIRSPWKNKMRPVIINNWEATYFGFDAEKILAIAKQAAALGVDMLVLDDGWFGKREDDYTGLGDWVPNEQKLGCSLGELVERVKAEGLSFGIWFEPEAVSEDSALYRAHPEWALHIPGREPIRSRYQLVLDFSRPEVVSAVEQQMFAVLDSADIRYVKWDMNRSLADVYSAALPPARQGEVRHRYVLGLYRLMEDLLARYPDLLLEGCSGGGGRFDAGMLYYAPQTWCSDDTDAVARTAIQYGTSFGYPMSSISAHVSVCPNHQNGRTTPLKTRGITAMQGTFGYEMDLSRLTQADKQLVKAQVARFHAHWRLFQFGRYYRLTGAAPRRFAAWEYAAENEACLAVVYLDLEANATPARIAWKGLCAEKQYALFCDDAPLGTFTGAQLMHAGMLLALPKENYDSLWYYAREKTTEND